MKYLFLKMHFAYWHYAQYNSQPMPWLFREPQYPFRRPHSWSWISKLLFLAVFFFQVGCFFFLDRGYNFWRSNVISSAKLKKSQVFQRVHIYLVRSFRYCKPWFVYPVAFVGASERAEIDVRTPEFHAWMGENSILGMVGSWASRPKYFIHSSTAGGIAALAFPRASDPCSLLPNRPESQAM